LWQRSLYGLFASWGGLLILLNLTLGMVTRMYNKFWFEHQVGAACALTYRSVFCGYRSLTFGVRVRVRVRVCVCRACMYVCVCV